MASVGALFMQSTVGCLAGFSALAAINPYAGASACGGCHPAQSARQGLSAHATALSRAPEHPLASSFPMDGQFNRPPDYRFAFSRTASELRTRILDKVDVMDLPMEWAFGAG